MKCEKCGKEIKSIKDIGFAQNFEQTYSMEYTSDGDIDFQKQDEEPINDGFFFCMSCGTKLPIGSFDELNEKFKDGNK